MAGTSATGATFSTENKLGGITLLAQGLVAASAQSSSTFLGKGRYRVVTTITAAEIATNDENYVVDLEANTSGATTTWYRLATIYADGAKEITGRAVDATTDTYEVIVDNPYDYQVRVATNVSGTVATGVNVGVVAYPVDK